MDKFKEDLKETIEQGNETPLVRIFCTNTGVNCLFVWEVNHPSEEWNVNLTCPRCGTTELRREVVKK